MSKSIFEGAMANKGGLLCFPLSLCLPDEQRVLKWPICDIGVCICIHVCPHVHACVCVCVCVRERERQRESLFSVIG